MCTIIDCKLYRRGNRFNSDPPRSASRDTYIYIYIYICIHILFTLLDLCVSSLRRGHANLLCIVPILTDDPRRESNTYIYIYIYIHTLFFIHAFLIPVAPHRRRVGRVAPLGERFKWGIASVQTPPLGRICVHVCVYIHMCMCVYTYIYIYMYIYIYIYTYICVCTYAYVYV